VLNLNRVNGIHHVTAIAGDAQRNMDFYTGILGMRLVKRTVNFDDPGTYHLYYGDELGSPGTILTFFPWPNASRGREGAGQVNGVALAVPQASLGFWLARLVTHGVEHGEIETRFGERLVSLRDPDGMRIEIVGSRDATDIPGWDYGPVPSEHAVRGVHAVTIWTERPAETIALVEGPLGMRRVASEDSVTRYSAENGSTGALLDVRDVKGFWTGTLGPGTVHHVAWRVPDDDAEQHMRDAVRDAGVSTTDIIDRKYFHSVYFREPGGTLFEIATDEPGFAVDEPVAALGHALVLPDWLEPERERIEKALPSLHSPEDSVASYLKRS
jgi:glyoxalase family protein